MLVGGWKNSPPGCIDPLNLGLIGTNLNGMVVGRLLWLSLVGILVVKKMTQKKRRQPTTRMTQNFLTKKLTPRMTQIYAHKTFTCGVGGLALSKLNGRRCLVSPPGHRMISLNSFSTKFRTAVEISLAKKDSRVDLRFELLLDTAVALSLDFLRQWSLLHTRCVPSHC